jgi:hypothetical protein
MDESQHYDRRRSEKRPVQGHERNILAVRQYLSAEVIREVLSSCDGTCVGSRSARIEQRLSEAAQMKQRAAL